MILTTIIACVAFIAGTSIHKESTNINVEHKVEHTVNSAVQSNTTAVEQTAHAPFKAVTPDYAKVLTQFKEQSQGTLVSIKNTFTKHPIKSVLAITAGSYLLVLYLIKKGTGLLENPQSWCNWKGAGIFNFEELKTAISQKYVLQITASPSSEYAEFFVKDVRQELALLASYVQWNEFVHKMGWTRLFTFKFPPCVAREKQQRLLDMLHMVVSKKIQSLG
jgi:hypothetical protein